MINKVILIPLFYLLFSSSVYAKETLVIAGAGPSVKIVDLFFKNFANQPAAQNYAFVVPQESIKHSGAMKHSFKNLFGRTGRPLNVEELNFKRKEIFLAMMPISIATGHGVNISKLSMSQLQRIFQKQINNWKRVGGPDVEITTVGREPTEAIFTELKRFYTFFRNSKFDVTLDMDHKVVDFLKLPVGWFAISFGAKANLGASNLMDIEDGLDIGVRLGLVYGIENEEHPLVQAVKEYAKSNEWQTLVKAYGAYPVN